MDHAQAHRRRDYRRHEDALRQAHLANLRKFAPKAKLIFATTTPMTTKSRPIGFDPEFNSLIIERNQIAVKVMHENQVPVADYYSLLAAKLDLAAGDRFHWTKPAYEMLAQCAAEHVAQVLRFPVRSLPTLQVLHGNPPALGQADRVQAS